MHAAQNSPCSRAMTLTGISGQIRSSDSHKQKLRAKPGRDERTRVPVVHNNHPFPHLTPFTTDIERDLSCQSTRRLVSSLIQVILSQTQSSFLFNRCAILISRSGSRIPHATSIYTALPRRLRLTNTSQSYRYEVSNAISTWLSISTGRH
jgi:hypothetical protein